MAQISTMESKVDIKSCAERFYQTYSKKQKLIPNICPNLVKDINVVKGDWDSVASLRKWTVAIPGNSSSEVCTLLIEAMDENNNSITSKMVDGDFKKMYNSCKFTIQVTKNPDGNGSSVKTTAEYEKVNADVPEPTHYFEDFAAALYGGIDAYLLNNS